MVSGKFLFYQKFAADSRLKKAREQAFIIAFDKISSIISGRILYPYLKGLSDFKFVDRHGLDIVSFRSL